MSKTAKVQVRVNENLKREAKKIFESLGLSMSEAINLYLAQVQLQRGIPFSVKIPNQETLEAIREVEEGKHVERFETLEELFESWKD